MADDQFTATMEWLLRVRREHVDILSLVRTVRKLVLAAYATQGERDILRWATPESEQVYEDLGRLADLLDPTLGRYLQGPVVRHNGYLPRGTMEAVDLNKPNAALPDPRPIVGPGRRFGYTRGR